MKKLFWKFKYARYIKRKMGLTMKQALDVAEASLEAVGYDLNEDPIYLADEEIQCWMESR